MIQMIHLIYLICPMSGTFQGFSLFIFCIQLSLVATDYNSYLHWVFTQPERVELCEPANLPDYLVVHICGRRICDGVRSSPVTPLAHREGEICQEGVYYK